jgi:hypothetical protein
MPVVPLVNAAGVDGAGSVAGELGPEGLLLDVVVASVAVYVVGTGGAEKATDGWQIIV